MKQLTFVLLLAQLSFAHAAEQKLDILGLYAGMPSGEIASLLRTKGWRCQNKNDPVMGKAADPITGDFYFSCDTSLGQLDFRLAGSLSDTPIFWVRLMFATAEKPDIVARSISQQFGKEGTAATDRAGNSTGYQWKLENGSVLQLSGTPYATSYMLELRSAAIQDDNAKAKAAKDLARSPTPKF